MIDTKDINYSIIVCTLDNTDGLIDFIYTLRKQKFLPEDLIIIHGRKDNSIEEQLIKALDGNGIRLVYATCPPGLVYQRNLGLELCRSEIVMFFDDDVLLDDDFVANILEVYKRDPSHRIGGVTGIISNMPASPQIARFFKRFFMLYTGHGNGRMYPSGMPSFLSIESSRQDTQFFAGCLMSFRMKAIRNIRFDEALHPYWWGDDFEFCYRVSQQSQLIQITNSRLMHKGSSVNKNSFRGFWRMQVVNHYYIFKKHRSRYDYPFYLWSLFGNFFFAFLQIIKGYRLDGLWGYIEGIAEILGLIKPKPADNWNKKSIKVIHNEITYKIRGSECRTMKTSKEY